MQDCCGSRVGDHAHGVMEQTYRKPPLLVLLPIEKLLITCSSFSCFWSAWLLLDYDSFKKTYFSFTVQCSVLERLKGELGAGMGNACFTSNF